jgi:hypothetical protein
MNIFYVHNDPEIAAQQLCDKHVSKMTLETAQILCNVSWRYGVPAPYKEGKSHKNHPCVRWAGNTLGNWMWTVQHGLALAKEFEERRGKSHASGEKILWCLEAGGRPNNGLLTTPHLCMPEQYQSYNSVESYRKFYIKEKTFATWKWGRPAPDWWLNGNS